MTYIINDILNGNNIIAVGNRGSGKTKLALTLAIDLASEMPNKTITYFSQRFDMSNMNRRDIADYMSNSKLTMNTNNRDMIKFSNGTTIKFVSTINANRGTSSDYIIFDDVPSNTIDDIFNHALPTLSSKNGSYILIFDEIDAYFYKNKFVNHDFDLNVFSPKRKDCVLYDIRD